MTTLREAAQQALEALEFPAVSFPVDRYKVAAALKAALEESTEKTSGNLVHIKLNIMRTALENIAGTRPIVDNLMSDMDIARIALERIDRYEHSTSKRPTPQLW